MESNITLRSNIYINKTNRWDDREFVEQLRDYSALSRYCDPVTGRSEVPLTPVQKEILRHGPPKCALETGSMSWGVPVGTERLVCRCEKRDCRYYSVCSAAPDFELVVRGPNPEAEDNKKEESVPSKIQERTERTEERKTAYFSQESIIEAGTDSRIIVNAGPGTGKTYLVVKRLQKLLRNSRPDKMILVLCFSKNAVQVILERLREENGSEIDAMTEEERLVIRTFDSYATYMLDDELPKGLNYDQRIELFIRKSKEYPDLLSNVEYLIVDEVQDTVGVRARMLRAMTEGTDFGVLLLGDRCQAIYDWSTRGSRDWLSKDLFYWVGSQGFESGELTENHRQTEELSRLSGTLRRSLLHGGEEEQEQTLLTCKKEIESRWPSYKMEELPEKLSRQSDLILCRTNGEAAVISGLLFGGREYVEHSVMQSGDHVSLAPWIGRILGGRAEPLISKEEFHVLADKEHTAETEEKWAALKSLDGYPRSAHLHRKEMQERLRRLESMPEICLNHPGNGVVVSTVHRAKGSEADHVYWLDTPLINSRQSGEEGVKGDALKAAYVAVTRAKREIRLVQMGKVSMRSLSNERWIKVGWSGKNRPFCGGITMQPEDVDQQSCADGPAAERKQEVIRTLKPGMRVELHLSSDGSCFEIQYDGFTIGNTSASFMQALRDGFRMTNKNTSMPDSIGSVYLSSLITVIQPGRADSGNIYQESGCWVGYELGGFARINYR